MPGGACNLESKSSGNSSRSLLDGESYGWIKWMDGTVECSTAQDRRAQHLALEGLKSTSATRLGRADGASSGGLACLVCSAPVWSRLVSSKSSPCLVWSLQSHLCRKNTAKGPWVSSWFRRMATASKAIPLSYFGQSSIPSCRAHSAVPQAGPCYNN